MCMLCPPRLPGAGRQMLDNRQKLIRYGMADARLRGKKAVQTLQFRYTLYPPSCPSLYIHDYIYLYIYEQETKGFPRDETCSAIAITGNGGRTIYKEVKECEQRHLEEQDRRILCSRRLNALLSSSYWYRPAIKNRDWVLPKK